MAWGEATCPPKTRQRPISVSRRRAVLGCPFWPVESPGAALRATTMELPDDPIQDGSQDPDGVPQQQQGEDIDNSDDEAPAAPASAPPVAPPPPQEPQEPALKKARTSAGGTRLSIASSNALDEERGLPPQPLAPPPPPPVAPGPNAAQQKVLDLVQDGKNVFYTGSRPARHPRRGSSSSTS